MCGIVGVFGSFSRDAGFETIARMNAQIVHRGPDDSGAWSMDGAAFGMRRLSIIDLSGGKQPIWTEDGVGIVFNGEIYNFRALRAELEGQGYRFATHSDTEVALLAYHRYGVEFVRRLEGMFAICLLDLRNRRVHLFRDRLGKKPLYYGLRRDGLAIASEIKALLAAYETSPDLNRQAIHDYLTLRYVPGPETIWRGVWKLEPGFRLSFDLKTRKLEKARYWSCDFESAPLDPMRDYPAEFERLFLEAVDKRLVASDVPVGVMLSGGLDSSVVCAAAVERGHKNFHTFSIAFEDGGQFSELAYARELARHIGSQHHEIVIGQKEFLDAFDEQVWFTDEPLADLATIPLYLVSKLAREHVKVALCGEGADEIFGGYDLERSAAYADRRRRLTSWIPPAAYALAARLARGERRRMLEALAAHGWSGYLRAWPAHSTLHWTEAEKAELWGGQAAAFRPTTEWIRSLYDACPSEEPVDQVQQVMCASWLVEDLLMKADKMSMAASLELRVPFLDHALVEWAARLPRVWKVGDARAGYSSKRIVRAFAAKRIPKSIIERPKQGFPVPAYEWLKGPLAAWAEDRVMGGDSRLRELFHPRAAAAALQSARAGDGRAAHKVWLLVLLERWLSRWQDDRRETEKLSYLTRPAEAASARRA